MPRKNENARQRPRAKKLKIKRPKAVLVPVQERRDPISPGRLVAIAEWRELA
ncbi:hypothetical protein [Lutispora sp.]|uniref:hypothetical protein n=1 Tax=Lutispora sp. TaxID=2828727 RepID=UPI002B1ECB21|nr:hypothetical protein [Lutispora sp.]MEA4960371.1 hypothetical protein [Lutispora sp.]